MNKKTLQSMIISGFCFAAAESAQAAQMEKCKIIGSSGEGLIKAKMCDCSTGKYSCAGQNPKGDPNAWIFVPKGICEKIEGGCLIQ
jgi:uncharacterized membrane protein